MSDKTVVEQIKHYQKDIDRCPQNSDRMIRCIQRLCLIPVTVQHLQITGIGRSVNSLRKYSGEVAEAAKALVAKWKAMVAAEESSEEEQEDETSVEDTVQSQDIKQSSDLTHKPSHTNIERKSSYKNGSNSKSKSESNSMLENERQHPISLKSKDNHEYRSKSNSDKCDHFSKNKVQEKLSASHKSRFDCTKSVAKNHDKDLEETKSTMKYVEPEVKRQRKSEHSSKEVSDRYSKDKSKYSAISRKDKTKHHDSSDDDYKQSSPLRKKRKKSIGYESPIEQHNSKIKSNLKEESYDESEENTGSEEFNDGEQESLNSEDGSSRHSASEQSDSDNVNSDHSSGTNSLYNNVSKKQVNGYSSETSESETDVKSSSSNKSTKHTQKKYSDKKLSRLKEARHHSDKRKHTVDYKSSHRDKYKNIKVKTEDYKTSSADKTLPIKIKEEKCDKVIIKKEKDTNSESKSYHSKNKANEKKSNSSQPEKASKSKNVTTKENRKSTIKIEKAEDGSIDCESGASFGDALLGMSGKLKKSQKKKSAVPSSRSSSSSTNTSSNYNSEATKSKASDSVHSMQPNLLTKNIKLEPLEVDLTATLPEITPNYRPLPRFSPPSSPVNKRSKLMSQEEALSSIMSTKNMRTKVFSGNKSSVMSTVPSLFDFCIQILRENIEALEYTGGVPYDVLKPVLDRATADQLYRLEHFNPYLIEDTDTLWAFHCNKDFRGQKRDDLESWRDLYLRCLDEREQKLKALTANISQSMAKSTPVRQTKLAYVDSFVKPPRNIARKQAKFGTASNTKHDIVAKAVVGAHNSSSGQPLASDVVPPPPRSSSSATSNTFAQNFLKKKKAPLMAKALQLIKGNRFKR